MDKIEKDVIDVLDAVRKGDDPTAMASFLLTCINAEIAKAMREKESATLDWVMSLPEDATYVRIRERQKQLKEDSEK